jgi:hypothetical protein
MGGGSVLVDNLQRDGSAIEYWGGQASNDTAAFDGERAAGVSGRGVGNRGGGVGACVS